MIALEISAQKVERNKEESPDFTEIVQRVTPFRRKARNSGTERISRAMILTTGTGVDKGAAGVKTAKLCTMQDQIGKRFSLLKRASG